MSDRVVFRDAFNPFLVRENVYTLAITFVMDMAVSVLGAVPLFGAKWTLVAVLVIAYYLAVNLAQFVLVLAFRLIRFDSDERAVHMENWAVIFIVLSTAMCVWPLHSFSIWVMNVIKPLH
jgi:uncharacterized membrane protein YqjE